MKKNIRRLVILSGVLLFCLAFSFGLCLWGKGFVKETPGRKKEFDGVSVNTVSIYDVEGVMKMTAVNYLPGDFAELNEVVSGEDTGDSPARRGTYRFCIDTLSGEEWNDTEKLDGLLKADGNWHLTLYIPPVFSACCVYVRFQNKEYIGTIDRYNVAYYGSFSAPSEFDDEVTHKSATQPVFVDIPIPTERKYSKECIVTLHYETDNDNFAGITDNILIGEDAAVRKTVENNRLLLLVGAILGAATLLLFLFICILKSSVTFVPQLLYALGVSLALFSVYSLFGLTTAPYFWLGVRGLSVELMLIASALYLPERVGRLPVRVPVSAMAAAAGVPAWVCPMLTSVSAYAACRIACIVLSGLCIAAVLFFTFRDIAQGKPLGLRLNGVIAAVLAVTTWLSAQPFPFTALAPAFWLCLLMTAVTVVLGFREFITAEIHNRYLTTNLETEVAKQTQDLQAVLSERDKILLYVSHDMKKTVMAMNGALTDLRQSLTEPELLPKVDCLLQKNAELKKDFADLGKYGRRNFVAEQSEVLDLCGIVRKVTEELRPDCEANGIVLTVTTPDTLSVYAKKTALESVLLNLILNAIEHSSCTQLEVTVTKRKGECLLRVIDNGTGIATDKDIFEPFVSTAPSENNTGLGLFLARSAIGSMHGELTCERKDGLTVFSATLPPA